MRIENKTSIAALLYIMTAALIIALGVSGRYARDAFGQRSQLLAKTLSQNSPGVDIWAVEDFIEETSALVTYEIKQQASAYAVNESHNMTIVGTNSAYAGVMGYPAVDGGFFTKDAFLLGAKEAVLNERAASTLFGGTRLAGKTFLINNDAWTVVGIILDDDAENDIIYVPASSELILAGAASASAGTLAVLQDASGGAGAAMAINKLKDLGVSDSSYSFKSLGKAVDAFGEMTAVALRFSLVLLLCLFAQRFGRYAFRVFRAARIEDVTHASDSAAVKNFDTGGRRPEYAKAAINVLLFAVCAGAALILARQIVEICITWQEIPLLIFETASPQDAFYGRLNALASRQAAALCLFAASAVFAVAAQAAAASLYKR